MYPLSLITKGILGIIRKTINYCLPINLSIDTEIKNIDMIIDRNLLINLSVDDNKIQISADRIINIENKIDRKLEINIEK